MKLIPLVMVALGAAVVGPAFAGERCFAFDKLPANGQWAVGDPVDMGGIGVVHVRDLLVGGAPSVDNPANKFLKVIAQEIAGGSAPEIYAKNVAVQMEPSLPVARISMRLSHQPGAQSGRPAFVEVNGERHEFKGTLMQLNGKTIGGAANARLRVDLPTTNGNFVGGRLKAESKVGIRSFTIGAAELRLDDVCFEK